MRLDCGFCSWWTAGNDSTDIKRAAARHDAGCSGPLEERMSSDQSTR